MASNRGLGGKLTSWKRGDKASFLQKKGRGECSRVRNMVGVRSVFRATITTLDKRKDSIGQRKHLNPVGGKGGAKIGTIILK